MCVKTHVPEVFCKADCFGYPIPDSMFCITFVLVCDWTRGCRLFIALFMHSLTELSLSKLHINHPNTCTYVSAARYLTEFESTHLCTMRVSSSPVLVDLRHCHWLVLRIGFIVSLRRLCENDGRG